MSAKYFEVKKNLGTTFLWCTVESTVIRITTPIAINSIYGVSNQIQVTLQPFGSKTNTYRLITLEYLCYCVDKRSTCMRIQLIFSCKCVYGVLVVLCMKNVKLFQGTCPSCLCIIEHLLIHSFYSLSYDRFVASSKAIRKRLLTCPVTHNLCT